METEWESLILRRFIRGIPEHSCGERGSAKTRASWLRRWRLPRGRMVRARQSYVPSLNICASGAIRPYAWPLLGVVSASLSREANSKLVQETEHWSRKTCSQSARQVNT